MSAENFIYDVFLSHSAKDKAVVRPRVTDIEAKGAIAFTSDRRTLLQ
jgi:hypothetical protein